MLRRFLFIFCFFSLINLFSQSDSLSNSLKIEPATSTNSSTTTTTSEIFKPKISLGVGMLSYHGGINKRQYQAPWTGKIGYDITLSQRLFKPLQLNFNVLYGKLGNSQWIDQRMQNFQSEIRAGGISLVYDFANFIPDHYKIRPWVSLGASSFEFLSKTDLRDRYGNYYYYWSDGSIMSKPEGSAGAVPLVRDYQYDTDIRELNANGYGRYKERAWAFPVGAGAIMQVTDRIDFKIGMQYYFTTTNYISGYNLASTGDKPKKLNDRFVYTSFSIQYDLIFTKKSGIDSLPDDYFKDVDWMAVDSSDNDEDGVKDLADNCHGTPKGVKVDASGCPDDDDKDGVPNYMDDEPDTPAGSEVNMNGVALNDEYWQKWYDDYNDSLGLAKHTERIDNVFAVKLNRDSIAKEKALPKYTIELARYTGPVPNEEMVSLLSIGDVKSAILSDNTTVIYTAGSYKNITDAVKRRDELSANGNKNLKIGYFKSDEMISLSEEEINQLAGSASVNTNTTTTNQSSSESNSFGKDDIVYRVQLGAYKNKVSENVFKNIENILEIQADQGVYRYVTKGFKTIKEAAELKADLAAEGYADAFITAYKNGKRIPLNQTAATVESSEKENLNEDVNFSSVDKNLISFKIQLGSLRKAGDVDFEEKTKDLKGIEKQETGSGMIRYTVGEFKNYKEAEKFMEDLANQGYSEAFVVAIFKGEVISIQEALELLK